MNGRPTSSPSTAAFKIKDLVDSIPPTQPLGRRLPVELAFIHRAICLADRFEKETERRRNIQIVVERVFEFVTELHLDLSIALFISGDFAQTFKPIVDSAQ